MKFSNEYRYKSRLMYPEHIYTVIGRAGAIHFHVTDLGEDSPTRYSAGLEMHSRAPLCDSPPHEKCWLIGGPCWHDGTSLYAQERLVPIWLSDPHDHEHMFRVLEAEYRRRFEEDTSPVAAAADERGQ
jgi:hypothetical protein